ncbi:hypothetical protein FHU10_3972 [Serratia fonticola]|uniref:Uncharacterized protein n=1 Tax=Serratia fonticola TaxID=47917 RepID=A0A559T9Q5_SERFO|nr:hypothetical protein FHU11_2312 [Serratia fonticola]TVZ71345.1 hypothetical protein FHU10_3972 [Serratia fonticola]
MKNNRWIMTGPKVDSGKIAQRMIRIRLSLTYQIINIFTN